MPFISNRKSAKNPTDENPALFPLQNRANRADQSGEQQGIDLNEPEARKHGLPGLVSRVSIAGLAEMFPERKIEIKGAYVIVHPRNKVSQPTNGAAKEFAVA